MRQVPPCPAPPEHPRTEADDDLVGLASLGRVGGVGVDVLGGAVPDVLEETGLLTARPQMFWLVSRRVLFLVVSDRETFSRRRRSPCPGSTRSRGAGAMTSGRARPARLPRAPKVIAPVPRLRLDAGQGHRVRRGQGPADRREQEVAVLDRPERLGPCGRDRLPGRHLERSHRGRLLLHEGPGRPREADEVLITLRRRGSGRIDGRPGDDAAGHRAAQHPRRGHRCRPARHGRGPARRHQEPRGLRGAGRDRAHHGAHGARERHRRARPGPVQAVGRSALGRARLRRPLVLPAQGALDAFIADAQRARLRRHPDDAARGQGRRHRAP